MGNAQPKKLTPWFSIGGKPGDRTLGQQLRGLGDMLERAPGKTILDVGCAEGLISMVLADLGADSVHGIDVRADFIEAANRLKGVRRCVFEVEDANDYEPVRQYDFVLLLAVLHKLRDPTAAAKRFAAAAREMVVVRLPPANPATVIDDRSGEVKHHVGWVIVNAGFMLKNSGFFGPKGEWCGIYERV